MTDADRLLTAVFSPVHVRALLGHYSHAIDDFSRSDWEDCTAKVGKFVEAVLKALATHCNVPFEKGRKFKADALMNGITGLPHGSYDDAVRVLLPRACRLAYDLASNRGARHDPDEIDPNSMDAHLAIHTASWILAEMIRYAQKGAIDASEAGNLVAGLTERKYPSVENVDGRLYLHAAKKSAVDVALAILAVHHPKRVAKADLVQAVKRNGFTLHNAKTAVDRISKLVDYDHSDETRLLAPGLKRAEEILKRAKETG
jgi:hypothetical protein